MTIANPSRMDSSNEKSLILGAWAVLMVLTALAWWLGTDHGVGTFGIKGVDTFIMVLTMVKVFVVSQAFMEQRKAASWLRLSFAAWYIVTFGAVLAFYVGA